MNSHPGGKEHTDYMLELAFLPKGSRWLDMGAGAGETLRELKALGYEAVGIDLVPRSEDIIKGDFSSAPFERGSFDGIISQCAFYCSNKQAEAISEAARLLRKGGRLLLSDVCFDLDKLLSDLRKAGFAVRHIEDLTPLWREYYFEALWREENVPRGKNCSYVLFVCERI